jgi:hypothetical protein
MPEPIDLKRFAPRRVLLLANHLSGDRVFESRGAHEGWAAINQLKFRDFRGDWWTVGICSRQWYCFIDRRWRVHVSPDGFLEGPAEFEGFAPPADTPSPTADDLPSSPSPARDAIEAITLIVGDTFGDYESGRLNSTSTTLLLKSHYLVDNAGRVWSLGCRSRTWYVFDAGEWHPAPTPALDSLPNPSQFAAMRATGQIAALTLLALEASSLPEPVTEPWNPPPSFPETPPPPCFSCTACGATNLRGSRFCSRCGAEPTKTAPPVPPAATWSAPPPRPAPPPNPLPEPDRPRGRFCPTCGEPVAEGRRFCTRDGTRVS